MRHALIHVAREVGTRKAAVRDGQGQYPAEPFEGRPVACRFMVRGQSPKRRRPDGDVAASTVREYELLAWHTHDLGDVDEAGVALPPEPFELTASMKLLVVAPPLTTDAGWEVEVAGDPELLNDGVQRLGWFGMVRKVRDAA